MARPVSPLAASGRGLTTVQQPLEEAGEIALQMLLRQLKQPGATRETTLDLTLTLRGSTTRKQQAIS